MKKLLTKKNSIIAMILVLFMLIGCSKSEEKDMNKEDKKNLDNRCRF